MIMRTIALSLATTLALTGCGSGKGDDGDAAAKPPAGGWPQPVDGKFTDKMCGLLTTAEWEQLGHTKHLPVDPTDEDGRRSSNFITCFGGLGGRVSLDLQPTAESAKVRYDRGLESRRKTVIGEKQETILAESVVPGVDESWYDYGPAPAGTKPTDYVLELRRGSLLVSLALDNDKVTDPKATIAQMAGLVVERIKDVGKTDTGTTPKVRFEVKGNGKVTLLNYATDDHSFKSLQNVDLPWSIELPMSDHGKQVINLQVSANAPLTMTPLHLACSIAIRGMVVKQDQQIGLVQCSSFSAVH